MKRAKGRHAWKPSDEARTLIERLSALGTSQATIAAAFNITPKTLRRECREQLRGGALRANYQVAETLFRMATSGAHPVATIFWAKTRNRFGTRNGKGEGKREEVVKKAEGTRAASTIVVVNNDGEPVGNG